MPYYSELAGDRVFRCSKCGRRKRVKYVPKSDLCRDCAAKNRRKIENIAIQLGENLVVTKMVEKRFTNKAEKDIPHSKTETVANNMERLFWALLILSAFVILPRLFNESVLFALGLYVGVPILVHLIIETILVKPRKERGEKIRARIVELAEDRKGRIEEAEQFYSSPEWNMLRRQVIKQKGRVCAECGRKIKRNDDVTVDHIKPRSKYPDLALVIDNLRVLCRSCNSRKGDREFTDILDNI